MKIEIKKTTSPKGYTTYEGTFQVTVKIDAWKARDVKNGEWDSEAYRNWNINYLHHEEQFIKNLIRDLKENNQYSGISVKVAPVPNTQEEGK